MIHLNEQQREAVEHAGGPLLIVAGAGTGKTRVIVEKVARLLEDHPRLSPESILALTFTNKAAEEMRRRIVERSGERGQRCCFSTFHSFCHGLLRENAPVKALDNIDQWIFFRRHLEELELDHYLKVSDPGRFLGDLVKFCSQCHDNLVTPLMYRLYVDSPLPAGAEATGPAAYRKYIEDLAEEWEKSPGQEIPPQKEGDKEIARLRELAHVYERSEELQAREGLVSFGAMISEVVYRLRKSSEWRRQLRQRFAYILVDEFQDTNAAQWELLKLLAGERRNVTVVGDDYQAIYRFRGAADGSLEQFEKEDFTGARRVILHQNYRSTRAILKVADTAIAMDADLYRREKRLVTSNPEGKRVAVQEFPDEESQAEFVAQEISRRVREGENGTYSEFAVLYRAHRNRDRLVAALQRWHVPFAIRNLSINNLPQVRDIVAYLRAIGHPSDSISLLRVMTSPKWSIEPGMVLDLCRAAKHRKLTLREHVDEVLSSGGGEGLDSLVEFLNQYRKIAQQQPLPEWLNQFRLELGLFARQEDEPSWRTFSEFVFGWDRDKSSTGLLDDFLEYFGYFEEAGGTISLPEDGDDAPGVPRQGLLWREPAEADGLGKVKLMTVHAAKGLEFEHVFLFHLIRGAFPVRNRRPLISLPTVLWKRPLLKGDFHLQEERRLFYVALTRAKSTLTLCTILNDRQKPSLFLEELRKSNCPELEWKKFAQAADSEGPDSSQEGTATAAPTRSLFTHSFAMPPLPAADDLTLSVSSIETYLDCPLKYFYSNVWQVPVTPSPALRFGSIMHGALKKLVHALAHRPETLPAEELESILREHWSPAGFTDPIQERKYWEMGLQQLEGIRRTLSAKPFELLSQERSFHFQYGGIKVAGRIDQINRISEKEVEVIEYKTGRAHSQKEADSSLQLTVYARACREIFGVAPVTLVLYNLQAQEELRTRRGPADFEFLEGRLRTTSANIAAGEFAPQPGFHCGYCEFRPICPAHEASGPAAKGPVRP